MGRFHKSFHGHAYMTEKGQRFVASVSFAPNQKCPTSAETSKRGRDAKTNTIHKVSALLRERVPGREDL